MMTYEDGWGMYRAQPRPCIQQPGAYIAARLATVGSLPHQHIYHYYSNLYTTHNHQTQHNV